MRRTNPSAQASSCWAPPARRVAAVHPLGSTLARLLWAPGQASLQQGEDRKTSDSLPTLVQELTGSDLPIAALFDWLQGRATAAAGWQVDLSRMEQGRLSARRHDPQPPAALRIVLDTP